MHSRALRDRRLHITVGIHSQPHWDQQGLFNWTSLSHNLAYMQWFQINFQRYKRLLLCYTWQHLYTCCFIASHSTAGRHVKQVSQFSWPEPSTQINSNNEPAARLAIWVHTLGRPASYLCSCSRTYNSQTAVAAATEQVHTYRRTHCITKHENAYPKRYTYLP